MKKTLLLNTGNEIPILGFGTWKLNGEVMRSALTTALDAGFRHIDTADRYGNHKDIAQVLDATIIAREELFITTKLWMNDFHREDVYTAGQRFLQELKMDYVDLLLMHWPDRAIPFKETLQAMNDLKERGMVKNIGVSNFTVNHLKDALATGIQISVNQVEFHPSLYQKELLDFCISNNIVLTAWSPLAQGADFTLPIIVELAKKYEKSPAQVVLNWIIQKDIVAIPKSTKKENIQENLKATEWTLSDDDCNKIDNLNLKNRLFTPAFADFDY